MNGFNDLLSNILVKGNIFYYKDFEFENGNIRNKYILILNKDAPLEEDVVLLVLTTSNTDYLQLDYHGFIKIDEEETDIFYRDTVIKTSEVRDYKFKDLKRKYNNLELEYKGKLPDIIISKIEEIVKNCPLIKNKYKKKIL